MKQAGHAVVHERVATSNSIVEELGAVTYRVVDDLQSVGVNVSEINKLKEAGFHTIGQVMQQPLKVLIDIKGLTEARVEKIREACRKLNPNASIFRTGIEVKSKRKQVIRITTGSAAFDAILGGGVETGQITEVFGEFRSGKTQLCHNLCVSSQLSFASKGGQGKAIYIDTEGNFRPERIESIAERYGLDSDQTLENIIHCRVHTHNEQMDIVKPVAALLADPDQGPYRLLIIDSIISLFRVEFSGRGELSERQQKLGIHMSQLEKLAEEFNIVVIITNQVMADPGALAMFGPIVKPVGGHVIAHASTTRVHLKKGKGEQRIAKIFDSPLMPEAEATFQISEGGIQDVV
jgi:meiotic recombination protein DMC1